MAQSWIEQGSNVSVVLQAVGVNRSTYYYRNSCSRRPQRKYGGKPAPGYSRTTDGRPVSDEQIKLFSPLTDLDNLP